MAVKHAYRKSQSVISQYGRIWMNEHGFVSNFDKLSCSKEQLLELPNFVDAATFKNDSIVPEDQETESETSEDSASKPSDEDYEDFFLTLEEEADPDDFNSEGYLNMDYVNKKLREQDWPTLSGSTRKVHTDNARRKAEETTGE